MGAEITRRFCAEGARVLALDVLDAEGEAVCAAVRADGHEARYRHLDVSSDTGWAETVADCLATFGPLNVLVNNAGIGAAAVLDEESWRTGGGSSPSTSTASSWACAASSGR
jgi:NAD(P)-dependent dehydrogenase (short-subunit alcohol dehydrogenase family)